MEFDNNPVDHKKLTKVVRQKQLTEKIVIVDGQPGCGKTMLSPIIASMERVELLSYAFEIEFICRLFHLKKIEMMQLSPWLGYWQIINFIKL